MYIIQKYFIHVNIVEVNNTEVKKEIKRKIEKKTEKGKTHRLIYARINIQVSETLCKYILFKQLILSP